MQILRWYQSDFPWLWDRIETEWFASMHDVTPCHLAIGSKGTHFTV